MKKEGLISCSSCPKRKVCGQLCLSAEQYVSQDHGYQKELPLAPRRLEAVAEIISQRTVVEGTADTDSGREIPVEILSVLSPRQRTCVELHYWEGLSLGRIAGRLKLSKSAVQLHLKAALGKLSRCEMLALVRIANR